MIFLELVGGIIAILLLIASVTQVIVPLFTNTPFFPLFRAATPLHIAVNEAATELEEKTELFILQKRLFELNKEQEALELQIAAAKIAKKP